MKNIAALMIATILLTACATTRISNAEREKLYQNFVTEQKLENLDRIHVFRFYGWRELDNKHLILSTSVNKFYFITLRSVCIDLTFSYLIGINNTSSSLMAKFDSIFVPKFPEQKCFIKSIHKLTRAQADEMRKIGKETS